jgi:plastocyanin
MKGGPLKKKLGLTLVAVAFAAVALAACGSSSSSSSTTAASTTSSSTTSSNGGGSSGGASSTLNVAADPSGALKYQQTSLSAKAGSVNVDFTNQSPITHNVTIQDSSGGTVGATDTISGSSTSTTVNLKPGTYTFFCSVDSHEQAGMKGTITVK